MEALSMRLVDITRIFGPAEASVRQALLDIIEAEHELLVLGQLANGSDPESVIRRNGQGYLQGLRSPFIKSEFVRHRQDGILSPNSLWQIKLPPFSL